MRKNVFIGITLLVVIATVVFHASLANADELVIQDDGSIELVITNNGVFGITTSSKEPEKTHQQPPVSHLAPQAPEKTVPLVPPHTETTVQINPPINDDKKVQVVITTQTTPSTETNTSKTQTAPQSPATESPKTHTQAPLTKNVEQVVAQGANGQPVITIESEKAHQLTIQQGSIRVTTSLPLQIDTWTHSLSIPSAAQSANINVLPSEALQGVLAKRILTVQSEKKAVLNLTQDASGIDYTITTQKQGKLFGVFPVTSPVQVKLSAQNGKVVTSSQSLLFTILGWFIK